MPLGKQRTREHVIADLGINHLERYILLCGHTAQRIQHDYGYNLFMTTYNSRGEIEQGWTYFQVKATSRLLLLKDRRTITWTLSRRDLKLWLGENYPVILVIDQAPRDRAYWLDVQAYFSGQRRLALFGPGKRSTATFRRAKSWIDKPSTSSPDASIRPIKYSIEGHRTMSKPVISFADLRRILLDLGLTEVVVPKSHVGFLHSDSGTEIYLPIQRLNQRVAPRYLAVVRTMLNAKGLLDGDEFDSFVADVAARHSVSG
jgi:hypothetical protein